MILEAKKNRKSFYTLFGCFLFFLITLPIFFEIYRTAAFETVPRDDYAPYLLTLIGFQDKIPLSPYVYRLFSVAVAIPFYFILPSYSFTNLSQLNPNYLQAVQALSFVSYLSVVTTAIVIFIIARKHFKASTKSSIIVGLASIFFSSFMQTTGIDPIAVLYISLLVLCMDRPKIFVPLILVSIGFNEKISILFAGMLFFRVVYGYSRTKEMPFLKQFISSSVAFFIYLIIISILDFPGNEGQTDPFLFIYNLKSTIEVTLTVKGIYLNVFPVSILLITAFLALRFSSVKKLMWSDISAIFILIIIASIADVSYNVGRIVMHSYPLYLPGLALYFDSLFIKKRFHEVLE